MVKVKFLKDMITFVKSETNIFSKNQHKRIYSIDLIIKEIIHVLKTGISWNLYRGPINKDSLYYNFKQFVKHKIFKKYYIYMINRFYTSGIYDKLKYTLTDTTFIPNCYGVESIGRNKQYKYKKGNKISLITDVNGIPISIEIGTGNEHDATLLIKNLSNMYINTKSYLLKNNNRYKQFFLADSIYDTENIRDKLKQLGYISIIDYNIRNTKDPIKLEKKKLTKKEKKIYKKRIYIEHTNLIKKQNRRLLNRFDKSLSSFTSFIFLAIIRFLSFKIIDIS
jgi:hypothetical protein